jgi:hypothetical protein
MAGVFGASVGYAALTFGSEDHEAVPATIPTEVREETGYHKTKEDYLDRSHTISIGGLSRTIEVTNRRTIYRKSVDLVFRTVRLANVTLVSTPSVRIAGREWNPVATMDDEQFSKQAEQSDNILAELNRVGEDTVSMLGTTTTLGRYDVVETTDEFQFDVELVTHVTEPVEHKGEYVSAVCVYPTVLERIERENVTRILENLTHLEEPASELSTGP